MKFGRRKSPSPKTRWLTGTPALFMSSSRLRATVCVFSPPPFRPFHASQLESSAQREGPGGPAQTWRSAPQVLQHSRYGEDWGAVSEAALGYPARAHQRPEDDFLHRLCRRDSGVTAAIAQCQLPDGGGILVERLRVARARRLFELHLQTPTRFGILQLQFAIPRRRAVLDRPDLQQHQLVAEIRQKLQRPFAALVIQEI